MRAREAGARCGGARGTCFRMAAASSSCFASAIVPWEMVTPVVTGPSNPNKVPCIMEAWLLALAVLAVVCAYYYPRLWDPAPTTIRSPLPSSYDAFPRHSWHKMHKLEVSECAGWPCVPRPAEGSAAARRLASCSCGTISRSWAPV
jgi:hypothetical protein